MAVRAIRGATQVAADDRDEVLSATRELVSTVLERNELSSEDLISILFTATPDLVSEFPALAARELGLGDVPLMCATEIAVPHALPQRSGTAFAEVARRKGDYAVCGAGVVVTLDADRRVESVRASYISVGPVPEVHDLTAAVHGKPADTADWAAAGDLARTLVEPDGDLHASADYRRLLVGVLTERTLRSAATEALERTTA